MLVEKITNKLLGSAKIYSWKKKKAKNTTDIHSITYFPASKNTGNLGLYVLQSQGTCLACADLWIQCSVPPHTRACTHTGVCLHAHLCGHNVTLVVYKKQARDALFITESHSRVWGNVLLLSLWQRACYFLGCFLSASGMKMWHTINHSSFSPLDGDLVT